ncbi:MAG: winged helix-turn-helix domain-containing protein [Terracidiphilus sp.]
MPVPSAPARVFRFDSFEVDSRAGELRKNGTRLRLQGQPLQLLAVLLQSAGVLVTREELKTQLWPADTFVDFDHSLYNAVARIREMLGDSAETPRYVETLSRRGYRFIGKVEEVKPLQSATGDNQRSSAADSEGIQTLTASKTVRASDAIAPRSRSIAVLPFVNLSSEPENEFFADGMTEDVIAHLAKIKALKVISRTSVMTFKKSDRSLREIGEKLGAATLLEGSVRRTSNRVRIVAQLVDAATDEHIWAETYDRDLTDIFEIQTDVALNIANALRAELSKDELNRLGWFPTSDLQAYDLYQRGRNWFYRYNAEGYRRGLIAFDGALARDPNFALAWASVAETHAGLCIDGFVEGAPDETIRLAKSAAAKARELDGELAEAHCVAGLIRFVFEFDWPGAENELQRAIELSPGSAGAHVYYGWLCTSLERYDDALREYRIGRDLDPIVVQSGIATILLRAGRNEEALVEAQLAMRNDPEVPRCQSVLGWALIFCGDEAAGIAALEQATILAHGSTLFLSQLGQAYAMTGKVERAKEILEQLSDRSAREIVSPYHFAYVHAGLGQADSAIDWLERAYEKRSGYIFGIKGSFLFRNLHGHPRFESLLRKMNLA